MKKVYFPLLIIGLLLSASIATSAQQNIDQQMINEKYDEVSSLTTLTERRTFFGNQTPEMRVALWHENIKRKTSSMSLTEEQKEILDVIRKKFLTVEFAESMRGKIETEAGNEYNEAMTKASQLLGREMMRDLFGILGDSKTLKK